MPDLVPARNKLTGALVNVRPDAVDIPGGFFESVDFESSWKNARKSIPTKSSAPKRAESKETDPPVLGDESKE